MLKSQNYKNLSAVYDAIASSFSATRKKGWQDFRFFEPYIQADTKILDIGCGNGRLLQYFPISSDYYLGVDISEKLLDHARSLFPEHSFSYGNMIDVHVDTSYDVICSIAAFHHLKTQEERKKALSHWHDLLHEDGYICMTVWNLWQKQFLHLWMKSISNFFSGNIYSPKDLAVPWKKDQREAIDRYYYAFTSRELVKLFTQSGFEIIHISHVRHGDIVPWYRFWNAWNILIIAQKANK